jgi:hypothetical protein
MSRIRADKFVNNAANGAPQLTYGAEIPVGVGLTGAGGINITGVATAANFVGNLTGNLTGNVTGTTGTFTGNVSVGGTLTYEDVTNIDSIGIITARSGIEFGVSGAGGTITSSGAATFTGELQAGTRVRFNTKGTRSNAQSVIDIYDQDGQGVSASTVRIDADGDATFAGVVSDSIGPLRRLGSNIKTSNYTLVAADAGKMVRVDNGSTITVPDNVFTTGDMITIVSGSSSNVPITEGTNVTLYNASDGTDGSVTLAARTVCTILVASGGSSSKIYIAGGGIS